MDIYLFGLFQILSNLQSGLAEDGSMLQLTDKSRKCKQLNYGLHSYVSVINNSFKKFIPLCTCPLKIKAKKKLHIHLFPVTVSTELWEERERKLLYSIGNCLLHSKVTF